MGYLSFRADKVFNFFKEHLLPVTASENVSSPEMNPPTPLDTDRLGFLASRLTSKARSGPDPFRPARCLAFLDSISAADWSVYLLTC